MDIHGKLTDIQTQKAHPDRVSLFVNDQYVIGIRKEIAFQEKLRIGIELSAADLERLSEMESLAQAKDASLKYLSIKDRPSKQMKDYLSRKEFSEEIIQKVLSFLEEYKYINDAAYAEMYVKSRVRNRPRGKAMIRWELKQKGIHHDEIANAMSDYGDEKEIALQLVLRKRSLLQGDDRNSIVNRIGRFLMRKGFAIETIHYVVKSVHEIANLDND